MSPTLLAAVTDVAMDDEFWAAHPSLEKRADVGNYDDGYVDIGGVRIPKKALYGLAMGGLAGGAGGVAGKMTPQQIALLVALGAAAGGVGGLGLHGLDSITESDVPGLSRTEATAAAARRAATAANSGFPATIGRALIGEPAGATTEALGTAAQLGTGAVLGNTAQRMWRMHNLNKLMQQRAGTTDLSGRARVDTDVRRLLGADEVVKKSKGEDDDKKPKPPKLDVDDLAEMHDKAKAGRSSATLADTVRAPTLTGRLRGLPGRLDRAHLGSAPQPWDLTKIPAKTSSTDQVVRRNFSLFSSPFGRNLKGTVGGLLAAAAPSLNALSSSSTPEGKLPLASAINHLRGRW